MSAFAGCGHKAVFALGHKVTTTRSHAVQQRVAWTMPRPLTQSPSLDAAGHAAATPRPVGSTRLRGARTAMRVTIAEISAQPAIAYNPAWKVPVLSLSQPTRLGPIRPPRLPSEFIAAMAAAAAVPLKKVEGSGQNDVFMP